MFGELIESIRNEAAERGSYSSHNIGSAGKKIAKQGASRFLRRQAKKELKGYTPEKGVNLPKRGTRGYAD